MRIILKLLAGMAAGIVVGLYGPDWLVRGALTVRQLLGELISFTIPLIILFFITSGIASLPRNSGRLLGRTIGFAYASTLAAGTLAFLAAVTVLPLLGPTASAAGAEAETLTPFVTVAFPPLFGVVSALVAAFIFGVGIASTGAAQLKAVFDQGREIVDRLLARVIIPLLPVYIAGVFAAMAADGSAFTTLRAFGLVLLLAVLMHWVWLTVLFVTTGLLNRRSPLTLLRNMMPAYVTALGTMSSAATIPVTLRAVRANQVRPAITDFVVPLCANIHLAGSTITIVTCATAVTMMSAAVGVPTLLQMLPFIMALGVIMIAAPGAPGGAVMAALGLLSSMLGFGEPQIALMIALYLAQDSFGTATNVTGDGAIAVWMDRYFGPDLDRSTANTAE